LVPVLIVEGNPEETQDTPLLIFLFFRHRCAPAGLKWKEF
jgi:hypothetical protein